MTFVEVSAKAIRKNLLENSTRLPPIVVREPGRTTYCRRLILGPCTVLYKPEAPLPSGASVYIETAQPVIADNEGRVTLPTGPWEVARIHTHLQVLATNRKTVDKKPPLLVQQNGQSHSGWTVRTLGPSVLVYKPDEPLDCGARLWLETTSAVIIDGKRLETPRRP